VPTNPCGSVSPPRTFLIIGRRVQLSVYMFSVDVDVDMDFRLWTLEVGRWTLHVAHRRLSILGGTAVHQFTRLSDPQGRISMVLRVHLHDLPCAVPRIRVRHQTENHRNSE
jgi:hypothetical protein